METVFMNIESEKYIAIKRASFERLAAEEQVSETCTVLAALTCAMPPMT